MRKCWKCAEQIQDEAIACRFCNADQINRSSPQVVHYGPQKNSFQSCMGFVGVVVAAVFVINAISSGGQETAPAITPAEAVSTVQPEPRFDTASVEVAKAAIKAEKSVVEFVFDPLNAVEWNIAVNDDGSRRYGLSEYMCLLIRDAGAYDPDVEVRIVDAGKRFEFKDAFREYSLGTVRCENGDHLD